MKKGTVKLQYLGESGPAFLEVPALVQGHLALTRPLTGQSELAQSKRGWAITHVKTGLLVLCDIPTLKTAKAAIADLEPENDRWNITNGDMTLYSFVYAIAQKYGVGIR